MTVVHQAVIATARVGHCRCTGLVNDLGQLFDGWIRIGAKEKVIPTTAAAAPKSFAFCSGRRCALWVGSPMGIGDFTDGCAHGFITAIAVYINI